MFADGRKNVQQTPGRQDQGVAIGQKNPPQPATVTRAQGPDVVQHFRFATRPEFFLRRGVHLAESALIPGATIGHRQNQGFRFRRRTVDRFDVTDRNHAPAVRARNTSGTLALQRAL